MSTVAPWRSSTAGAVVVQTIGGIRQEASQARGFRQESGWGGLNEPRRPTQNSMERGFRVRGRVDDEWGRSESFDPDNVGDIADEGMGHRG
jgi:hypothetical protein